MIRGMESALMNGQVPIQPVLHGENTAGMFRSHFALQEIP